MRAVIYKASFHNLYMNTSSNYRRFMAHFTGHFRMTYFIPCRRILKPRLPHELTFY